MIIPCYTDICTFPKSLTPPVVFFELLIFFCTASILAVVSKIEKQALKKYAALMAGVFLFELFTAPLWNNDHLGAYAYIYQDVSWVLTVGWSTLIYYAVFMIDQMYPKKKALVRFILYQSLIIPLVLLFESVVVKIGIRSYAPEALDVIAGQYMPVLDIPYATFYYVPVFTSLVIGFTKYWHFAIDKTLLIPVNKRKIFRNFFLACTAVFLFEVMVEPMVENVGLPGWSYIYRDISMLLSGVWIATIAVAVNIIDKYFIHLSQRAKFAGYIVLGSIIAIPVEAWLIASGYRVYGPSAVSNFSGINSLIFHVPVEVVFAIPFYLALMIGCIKYWAIVMDNKL